MKTIILIFIFAFTCANTNALEVLVRIGSAYPSTLDSKHGTGWRDGEIIDIRPTGTYHRHTNNAIIDFPNIDYNSVDPLEIQKKLFQADSTGKYEWNNGYNEKNLLESKRDSFIDFQDLFNKGEITKAQYDSLYDYGRPHIPISFTDLSIFGKILDERTDTRLNEK